ncbi:MAG: BspA family leucine-rich repeat surface protein [Prevotella sp.]|nr:BspA family leucine-rich repeat surface protein [Prevotella sp.]
MFKGCNQLVGGEGFTYSNNCVTAEYANPGEQGYFTKDKPYAWLSNDNKTLTFYYGAKPANGLEVGPFTSASRRAWHENDVLITKVEFDKSMENCTSITSTAYWFSGLLNLNDIEGLEYLKTENVTDMKYMFNDCKKLTNIELNGFKTAKVKDMSYMFNNCQTLESLDVSDFKTAEVTNMQNMFCNVRNLTSLDVSGFNTAKVTYMDGMFSGCGVRTIYCDDDWYNPNIFSSDYMFDECWNLVGGSGFDFDEDCVSGEYANPGEEGYFTRKSYMKGDVNGDGKVTPADAIMILYHYFNVNQNGFKLQAADLNGDGNITPADAIETLYKYFGNGNHNARATRPTTSDSRNPE